ncbi:MAG: hypothetical protein KGS45_13295 [Planctomycetes bacterium]|nr:hypothetical protein [Planctomycetota bacterium]
MTAPGDESSINQETPATTWTILLAKWVVLSQASLHLPKSEDGERWRSAIPAIINLQAVTHAMGDMDDIEDDERGPSFIKAKVLVQEQASTLHALWHDEPLPEMLTDCLSDANDAIELAQRTGLEWIVVGERLEFPHPGELIAILLATGFDGDLYVPTPGVDLFTDSPCAFLMARDGAPVHGKHAQIVADFLGDEAELGEGRQFRQVYRQFDFLKGGPVRDLVSDWKTIQSGQPLLVQGIQQGQACGVTLPGKKGPPMKVLPVEFAINESEA